MAAPIELKANKPGSNTFAKSVAAQNKRGGTSAPAPRPKMPTRSPARRSGTKSASMSMAEAGFIGGIMGGNSLDYASSWMQSKGLKNAQNDGRVPRVPYATVPADRLTAGSATNNPRRGAGTRKGTSNAPVKARVVTKYTGKSYKTPAVKRAVTRKARVIPA